MPCLACLYFYNALFALLAVILLPYHVLALFMLRGILDRRSFVYAKVRAW
jgi:hypothetical protein